MCAVWRDLQNAHTGRANSRQLHCIAASGRTLYNRDETSREVCRHVQRICFVLRVRKDRLEEYRARHREVWPEMLAALRETGWHNYSLFLREDGLLVGYLETPDFDEALKEMAATEVNARWQNEMRDFFEDAEGRPADRQIAPLEQVF